MKKGKKLSVWQTTVIVVGIILGVAGIVIGVLAINGLWSHDSDEESFMEECGWPSAGSNGEKTSVRCFPSEDKPIIYLYPEEEMEISVKLGAPEKLLVSYPSYGNGWEVLAEPSGKLKDLNTGRELYSLYWEGKDNSVGVTDEGFVVDGEDVAGFLEEKLALLGLNDKEAEEFIIYWLPKLQLNKYNYIRFASTEEIEDYMPLIVTPRPDTTIRIMMIASPLDESVKVEEQILPSTPERNGFTIVEWGGSLVE